MNSNSRHRFCLWFTAAACLVGLAAPTAHAQAFYVVSKNQSFFQASGSGAVADPLSPFSFSVESATNATLTLPSGSTQALSFVTGDNSFQTTSSFATKAALDAAYPNGTYRLSGASLASLAFNLTADTYPSDTPQVTNGTWNGGGLLVVNPAQTTTINLSTFTGYATSGVAGHMETSVRGLSDNVMLGASNGGIISVANPFGLPVQSTPLTSITIPAGVLTSCRVYQGEVQFDTLTTLDTTTVPGAAAVAIFSRSLTFFIAAQATGTTTPPPVIARQPANQTGVLGGTVTFSLNVTVGGSPQFNNLSSRWFFNGRELNLDGTKYSFSSNSFGLTVRNLTAADVGSYTVLLINAGGLVTSAPATLTLAASAAPTFSLQPASQTITNGSTIVFAAAASGVPTPSYQWRKNNVAIFGATNPTLVLFGASTADAGAYSVTATNSAGTATSLPANLTIAVGNDFGRLSNLSILTDLTATTTDFTLGTVIGGANTTGTKPLLIRAVGPSLNQLIGSGALADSKLELFSDQTVIASNDDWAGTPALLTAFAQVGAFGFINAASKDAALFIPLTPRNGGYTVRVSGAPGATGRVIAEIYDSTSITAFPPSTPRLINVSVRKQIDTGTSLTAGFVIAGSTAKTVLVRAIGPGLAVFGVPGLMADPRLELFNSSSVSIAANDNWGGDPQLTQAGARVGAFAIANQQSADAMLLITLAPGNYTAVVSGVGAGGAALVEVYEVP